MNQYSTTDKPTRASGRFGRLSYLAWLFISSLLLFIALWVVAVILGYSVDPQKTQTMSSVFKLLYIIFYLIFFYFSVIFTIRRLHDCNQSGWLALIMLIPLLNIFFALYLIFAKGTEASNKFGPPHITAGWEKVLGWLYILLIPLAIMISAAVTIPAYQKHIQNAQLEQFEQIQPSQAR